MKLLTRIGIAAFAVLAITIGPQVVFAQPSSGGAGGGSGPGGIWVHGEVVGTAEVIDLGGNIFQAGDGGGPTGHFCHDPGCGPLQIGSGSAGIYGGVSHNTNTGYNASIKAYSQGSGAFAADPFGVLEEADGSFKLVIENTSDSVQAVSIWATVKLEGAFDPMAFEAGPPKGSTDVFAKITGAPIPDIWVRRQSGTYTNSDGDTDRQTGTAAADLHIPAKGKIELFITLTTKTHETGDSQYHAGTAIADIRVVHLDPPTP